MQYSTFSDEGVRFQEKRIGFQAKEVRFTSHRLVTWWAQTRRMTEPPWSRSWWSGPSPTPPQTACGPYRSAWVCWREDRSRWVKEHCSSCGSRSVHVMSHTFQAAILVLFTIILWIITTGCLVILQLLLMKSQDGRLVFILWNFRSHDWNPLRDHVN